MVPQMGMHFNWLINWPVVLLCCCFLEGNTHPIYFPYSANALQSTPIKVIIKDAEVYIQTEQMLGNSWGLISSLYLRLLFINSPAMAVCSTRLYIISFLISTSCVLGVIPHAASQVVTFTEGSEGHILHLHEKLHYVYTDNTSCITEKHIYVRLTLIRLRPLQTSGLHLFRNTNRVLLTCFYLCDCLQLKEDNTNVILCLFIRAHLYHYYLASISLIRKSAATFWPRNQSLHLLLSPVN